MKSRAITIVKLFSLSILFSCLVFGLYAQNEFKDLLSRNEMITKAKPRAQKSTISSPKLALFNEGNIVESQKNIENWMFDLTIIENDDFELEEWMFDEYFWEIKKQIIEEEIIEEQKDLEPWMLKLETN